MITRNMNVRITIYKKSGGQNEDGEVITPKRKDVLTCWAEVKKTTVKSFIDYARNDTEALASSKDTKVFLIRYYQKAGIDKTMFVDFEGLEYKITAVELDYSKKEMIMISAVRIS